MLEVLKALFGSGRSQSSLVIQATNHFLEMLDLGESLLEKAQPHLLDKNADNQLLKEARDIDQSTNKLVRAVRKILIAHLAFNKQDASSCLILMSVVKDAERLVDECRSLLQLGTLIEDPVPEEYSAAASTSRRTGARGGPSWRHPGCGAANARSDTTRQDRSANG